MILEKPKKARGFFYKTFSTVALVSIVMQVVTLSAFAYYILFPLANRSANDLSNLILFSAERWAQLTPGQYADFSQKMLEQYNLIVSNSKHEPSYVDNVIIPPYVHWLSDAIGQEQGRPIAARASFDQHGEKWFWVNLTVKDSNLRFGFPYSRIGVNPPRAFFVILLIGLAVLIVTTTILTRHLTKPIDRLYHASKSMGKGNWPEPIQAQGPKELIALTQQFNKMNRQVQELLSNRTVLLAGIAHDLRTPLTQIHLALSMLPNDGGDAKLMHSIQQDLNSINQLISEALNVTTALSKENQDPAPLTTELDKVVNSANPNKASISVHYDHDSECQAVLYPLAFKRVLGNLISNAIRHSGQQLVEIVVSCSKAQTSIQVKDRGPGIDNALKSKVFQPFYRLDKTRNSATGGSGLGLAIVRQLADLHDWQIELKDRVGGGTNAILTIHHQDTQ